MGILYDLVKEAKGNTEYETKVIRRFEPKIRKSLYLTRLKNRDDLEQELKIKLIRYVRDYSLENVPGLFDEKKQ
ncbi:helix-turn-helix domain-containing protein [Rossellomorea vietnamensis]|uniref:helix-turn-helix domain-containing protein n=1 Tax=Rossellomorea vietnamensis TaxID=218284 RepID=UPI003D2C461A